MKIKNSAAKMLAVLLACLLALGIPVSEAQAGSAATTSSGTTASVAYTVYVQDTGWLSSVSDGDTLGTTGMSLRMEALQIVVSGTSSSGKALSGSVKYRVHMQTYGWQDWVSDGATAGSTTLSKRLEAIQIELTGELAEYYDIYYRVHVQTYGWLDWACNGEASGTSGQSKRIEAIEIVLVEKGGDAPEYTGTREAFYENAAVYYQAHVQTYGWQSKVQDGATAGTTGKSKRMEAIKIKVSNTILEGSVEYRSYVQGVGWQDWVSDNEISGTTLQSKRIEAIQIQLTDELAEYYDIYYRVHVQTYGWTAWTCNGVICGSTGMSKRIEAIEIVLVRKDDTDSIPTSSKTTVLYGSVSVSYQVHSQTYGWLSSVSDGTSAGTISSGKRLEALKVTISDSIYSGSVQYTTYVQDVGWQDWVSDGTASGTTGSSKRIEAIKVQLTDELAEQFDIYYRVYSEYGGWTDWASNGAECGRVGYEAKILAIQIKLVAKGGSAPGSTSDTYSEYIGTLLSEVSWGVDVSLYQGSIDWETVADEGVEFAMIKINALDSDTGLGIGEDPYFMANAMGALANDIPIGIYVYIYGTTTDEVVEEAQAALELIEYYGFDITYPVAYDLENKTAIAANDSDGHYELFRAFASVFEEAGYEVLVYGSCSKLTGTFDYDKMVSQNNVWLARYYLQDLADDGETFNTSYAFGDLEDQIDVLTSGYEYGSYSDLPGVVMWQYCQSGTISGISSKYIDLDVCYVSY